MVGKQLLHYTVTAELGAGAMGRVYLARDTRTERWVAIKFLAGSVLTDSESRDRLVREARAASRLSHPGIVTLYSLEEVDAQPFLIQEYVEGETLAQRLTRGALGTEDVLRLAHELGSALVHAHSHGVVHRDLKPENVLIGPGAHYKIADFGVAYVDDAPTMTAAGSLLGSLPYMAPERLRGERGDARADLFAIGAILYEAMSGQRAFSARGEAEALYQVLNVNPQPLETADPRLRPLAELVERLLAKDPRERPESADSLLEPIVDQHRPDKVPVIGHRRERRRIAVLAAVILSLALAGFLAWKKRPDSAPAGAESSIAVLYFDNIGDPTDRDRLGPITSNLLITSLAQAKTMHVLSTQRILDALIGLGRGAGVVDRSVALEVAQKLRAGRIVTGTILQSAPNIVMTAELSNVQSGEVIAATRIDGEPGQTVFQVVDALGARLLQEIVKGKPQVLDAVANRASADLVAMTRYVDGLEQISRGNYQAAVAELSDAVTRDPGFAQAHFYLAIGKWWLDESDWAGAHASLDRARAHAERLSPWEREAVEGLLFVVAHRHEAAIATFTPLVRLDPGNKLVLYGLLEAYFHSLQNERAIETARRVLELDPHFSPAANHLSDALISTGKWDEAEREIAAMIRANSTDALLRERLVDVSILRGDGAGAVSAIRHSPRPLAVRSLQVGAILLAWDSLAAARDMMLSASEGTPGAARARTLFYDLAAALHDGRFHAAEANAHRVLALVREGRHPGWDPPQDATYRNGISAAIGTGDALQALVWSDSTAARQLREDPGAPVFAEWSSIPTRIALGRVSEAQATLHRLERRPDSRARETATMLDFYRGCIELGQGHWLPSLASFKRANTDGYFIQSRPLVIQSLMGAGSWTAALGLIDTTLRAPAGFAPDMAVRLHLYRGQVLEKLNRPADAAQSYRRLLHLWRNADRGTPEVGEAQVALARLERPGPTAK